ncbi:VpsR-related response regulator [Cupriavidus basilensis]
MLITTWRGVCAIRKHSRIRIIRKNGEIMNAYESRPLLYLSRQHDATLCRFLTQQGWKLLFARSRDELDRLPLSHQPMAGLWDLHNGFDEDDLDAFEPWFGLGHIGWVGLVSSLESAPAGPADSPRDALRRLPHAAL